jgi:hypothetical protein
MLDDESGIEGTEVRMAIEATYRFLHTIERS